MKPQKSRILITGRMTEGALKLLRHRSLEVDYRPEAPRADVLKALSDVEGLIIRTSTTVDEELLAHAPKLRLVCRAGTGLDNVDLEACHKRKVKVLNTPLANRNAVVEHTLMVLLELARRAQALHRSMSESREWKLEELKSGSQLLGFELKGKTLGIIGLGRIGSEVARLAMAFGMKVLASDPYIKATVFKRSHAEKVTLSRLLKQSDFVSLHVPLTAETRGLLNAENFAKMKPTAFLINTCRGPVVNENALLQALDRALIAGGAIDVFEEEPLSAQSPLRSRPQLLLTPHTAGVTRESQIQMSEHAAQQVRDYFFSG